MKYRYGVIAKNHNNAILTTVGSYDEARMSIELYEEIDKDVGIYEENAYEVIDYKENKA